MGKTREARQTSQARRMPWMRRSVSAVVAVKLAGLVPLAALAVGAVEHGGRPAGDARVETRAASGADRGGAAAPDAPVSGAHGGAAAAQTSPVSAESAARIPGDGPSAAFALERRGIGQLVDALQQRDQVLAQRDAELARREAAMATAAKDLEAKIAHLQALTGEAPAAGPPSPARGGGGGAGTAGPTGADGAGDAMAQLAKIYGAMKAEEAAPLFNRLDEATVFRIFQHMKERQISAVLPLMDPEKAVALTELLGGRRLPHVAAAPAQAAAAEGPPKAPR
jgi:flagellar motility protein MotE (MotC chaperone)